VCVVVEKAEEEVEQTATVFYCTTLEDFDGSRWGEGYLTFKADERLACFLDAPLDDGWAFGEVGGISGWYPPSFAQ